MLSIHTFIPIDKIPSRKTLEKTVWPNNVYASFTLCTSKKLHRNPLKVKKLYLRQKIKNLFVLFGC